MKNMDSSHAPQAIELAHTYGPVLGLSLWGAMSKFFLNIKKSAQETTFFDFVGHCCVGVFTGLIAYIASEHYYLESNAQWVVAGVAGFVGGYLITLIEKA
ncbi:MAG: hypothetical protein IPN33_25950 [Saprospiraceae bacterium]|nr:hypothetical protein [Saprospiraceae bacterium]